MPTSFRVFRHRSFTILWTASFVSNVGTWMETVALGRYVQEETGKAAWAGLIAAAGFLPTAIVGLLGGALADRRSRRAMLVFSSVGQAVIAAVVTWLVASGRATPGLLAGLTLIAGCVSSIGFPAWQTAVPMMVPAEEVPSAIGLSSVQWNLGRVFGPVLAGLVISLWSITAALSINVVSFFAVTLAALLVAIPKPVPNAQLRSIGATILDGWRTVRTVPALNTMYRSMMVTSFVAAPFIALIPAMVEQVLHGGRSMNSALLTAQGLGAVVAGVALGSLIGRFGQRWTLVGLAGALGPALVLYGAAPGIRTMSIALGFVGACYMGTMSTYSTIGQTHSPSATRGSVMAINNAVLGTMYPLGAVFQGAVADRVGLRQVTIASGILLVVVVGAVQLFRPGFTDPLSRSQHHAPA